MSRLTDSLAAHGYPPDSVIQEWQGERGLMGVYTVQGGVPALAIENTVGGMREPTIIPYIMGAERTAKTDAATIAFFAGATPIVGSVTCERGA